MHNVTVLYYVLLSLNGQLSCLADSCLRAILDIVVVLNHLSTDKALFKVGMDDTSTLRSLPTLLIGPCLHLHLTSGDKGLEVQ